LLATSKIINDKSDSSIQVQAMTGDEFLRIGNGSFPTFLKIDVEGHELSVLRGME
jgi:FkbM family methyltransferase